MNIFKNYYSIKLISLNKKNKSYTLKIPSVIFWATLCVLGVFLSGLFYLSFRNIYANYELITLKKKAVETEQKIKIYDDFYKKYLTRLEELKFYTDNSFLVVDNANPPNTPRGGEKGNGAIDLDSIKKENILNKESKLNSLGTGELLRSLPDEFDYFDDGLKLIQSINKNINFQKKEALLYLPFLSPVKEEDVLEINFLNNNAFIKSIKDTEVVSTAKGKVVRVANFSSSSKRKNIIIEHNFGIKTIYNNVENLVVKPGQELQKGQPIAEIKAKEMFIYQVMIGKELVPASKFMFSAN